MTVESPRILVVDDNEHNRDMLSRRLKRQGYAVETASEGKEALEKIADGDFALVLLDVMMPGMSGLDVLRQVRETHSIEELPVIMATAKGESHDIIEALDLQANDYVVKPIDFPVLLARVRTQLSLRRMAELKDDFLRIASHDLKGPLHAILSAASLIAMEVRPGQTMSEEMYEFIELIRNRTRQMWGIIEDFLDFQAFDDGQIQLHLGRVDLNEVVRTVTERNRAYAESKEIKLSADLAEPGPVVHADAGRLEQVIENFVSNAIKFSFAGSATVARTRLDGGGSAFLEVVDQGPGLKPEDEARLFMKYARLSNQPTGGEVSTGLGLAICKRLIELHNGEVGARNNAGEGSTFWFRLPPERSAEGMADDEVAVSRKQEDDR
jgi:two-component system, sensor histidine kinase and response regulator